jgi:peroxiredoxin (alkyl hydroperoxide reductase subunit C)
MSKKKWFYDYENKCDCSEDDKCGCTFPNNMKHNFDYELEENQLSAKKKIIQNHLYIGDDAPDFEAAVVTANNQVNKNFSLYNYIEEKYALLLFYPADFSSVCPSELIAFNRAYDEFIKRNVMVVAISVDSLHSHVAWKKLPIRDGGVGNIKIPLVSDISKSICFDYGVLSPEGNAYRSTFIIDNNMKMRYMSANDKRIGREVSDILRIVDVLQSLDNNESVCSFGWNENQLIENKTNYLNK